ncbi:LysR family transcriptional regulator [Alkalibacter mobilis]|uniref:LysR family transcriptional regulator n=1 Tax=Alkalibacter mobilis TaxID=2787712 RepID=UPI00189CAD94|nr:LysR family transcriptional regulator [Alkalibacter mobilis]MBF7097774.1 LysR family transcriptional regulator [Alkalibacter mobilis]
MNILQMQQFRVIARNESISKAAEELFISPPALSKVLRKIEEELNCNLFIRNGRNINLNDNGKKLLEHIDVILNNYELIFQYFNSIEKNITNPIRLCNIGGNMLDQILLRFTQKYPDISIKIEITSFKKSLDLLLNKEADVIFTDNFNLNKIRNALEDNEIISVFLLKNQLFVSAPYDSADANRKEIRLKELENEKLIRVSPEDPKGIAHDEYVHYISQIQQVKLNFIQSYPYAYFEKITINSPFLSIGDTLHISYYLQASKLRNLIKIINDDSEQEIYLCYRSNDKNSKVLVEYLKNQFYTIFPNSRDI